MVKENHLGIVQTVRAKYPTPLGAKHAEFLLEVARALKCGLVLKPSGVNITLPDGAKVSQDFVMDKESTESYDFLIDAEGAATPTWGFKGLMDPARFYEVKLDGTEGDEDDDEDDEGDESDGDGLEALEALLRGLRADMDNAHARIAGLEAAVKVLAETKGSGVDVSKLYVEGTILGMRFNLPVRSR